MDLTIDPFRQVCEENKRLREILEKVLWLAISRWVVEPLSVQKELLRIITPVNESVTKACLEQLKRQRG